MNKNDISASPQEEPRWLSGTKLAARIRANLSIDIKQKAKKDLPPRLAVVLVGDDAASEIYVNKKRQACLEAGIVSDLLKFPANISEPELHETVVDLNDRSDVHGILVQLPLPEHLSTQLILETIEPSKDVDGFHAFNLGRLAQRAPLLRPCTPKGIMALLQETQVSLKGKHAVVVGASNIVGRPMALELLLAGCTTTICHRFTNNLAGFVREADILVAAAGKPGLIEGSWLKPGCIGIDVGIHRLENGKLTGDINHSSANYKNNWLTPVPGGVGPMTVASLLENTWQAYQLQSHLTSEEETP